MNERERATLRVRLGSAEFEAYGEAAWVDSRYERFVADARRLSLGDNEPPRADSVDTSTAGERRSKPPPLATFLREVAPSGSQVERFLAAAVWLERGGTSPLTAKAIARALSENRQKRLANPSDCLNRNVSKGYAEKTELGFAVTDQGRASLERS